MLEDVPPQGTEILDDLNARGHAVLIPPEERLRLLEESARDYAIVIMTADGRIANWSAGAERMMGWAEAEVVGRHFAMIFTPEDRARGVPAQKLSRAELDGRVAEESFHVKKDGTCFWASGVMSAMREHDGGLRGFAKILRDETAQNQAQTELAASHARERRTAEVLQRSLLLGPPRCAFAGLEVSTRYEPAGDDLLVGGDFFDAFRVGDERVALVVGDVVGKGLEAAAHTAQIKFALRAFLRERPDPAEAIQRLNAFLCECERLDGHEGEMEARFAVLSLVVINTASGAAQFAGLGMDPPLILRAAGGAQEVPTGGTPLGVLATVDFAIAGVPLEFGDVLLLATDGVTEARHGGEFLGYAGMTRIAQRALALGSLEEMGRAIVEGARAFGGGFRDDVCVLLARRV